MKGDRLAASIKALVPQQPIVMITAYGERLRSESNHLPGVDLVLAKPFTIQQLRQAIASLLAGA
jgi:CheY-like chemotaxis protein